MNVILPVIRLLILCASTYGYMRYMSEKIAPELSIGFTFTAIGTAMFFAGILNLMPEAALLVCAGGFYCLVRTLLKDKRKLSISMGGVFFIFMCALLAVRLYGEEFIHLDNYTHWGVAVRHMLQKDRFFNFTDSYVRFQSYPLGAGALIYYFAKISGIHSEWFMMLAHWACAAAMFSGLFCLAKNVPAKIACFVGSMLLLCVDNNFDQLLVDSALAFVALGAAAFCACYVKDMKTKGFYLIPWLTFLITVKNSGALFVLFVVFLAFIWGGWKKGLAALLAPAATLLIWNRHVAYVFEGGLMAQHSMSLDNFKRMLSVKRAGSVETIVSKMVQEVFSVYNKYLPVFIVSVAAFVLALIYMKQARAARVLLVYGVACYLLYQVGMTGMYIFTMSEKEAVRLASYARYHGTILIFASGVMLMALVMLSEYARELKHGPRWMGACCAACVLAIVVSGMPKYEQYLHTNNEEAVMRHDYRQRLRDLSAQYGMPDGASYYVLVDEEPNHAGFLFNMINCMTLAEDVQVRTVSQIYSEEEIDRCDYMVAFGEDEAIGDYIYENYGTRDRVIKLAETPRIKSAEADEPAEEEDDKQDAAINLLEAMKGQK